MFVTVTSVAEYFKRLTRIVVPLTVKVCLAIAQALDGGALEPYNATIS